MKLGVNIDHVATLRNARGGVAPDPVAAALVAAKAGADNITCHLREDRRHIRDNDVWNLRQKITVPLNLEMAATPEMLNIACKVEPHTVTIVPEGRQELTTEGGLSVFDTDLHKIIAQLRDKGISVALFIDTTLSAVRAAHKAGANAVELHVGDICAALQKKSAAVPTILQPAVQAAQAAYDKDLEVHIGHGIDYDVAPHLQGLPCVSEADIGHAIIAESLFSGLDRAVRRMKALLSNAPTTVSL